MSHAQGEIHSSCFIFVTVFALVRVTEMHIKSMSRVKSYGVPNVHVCANLLILA